MPEQRPQGEPPQKSIYMPYGATGGGGEGGTYVFTDLDHLDRIIGKWSTIRDDIISDGFSVSDAVQLLLPPAEDTPSMSQAKAAGESLVRGQEHSQLMADYADGFIQKLAATRAEYAATEENATEAMRNADPNP